MVEEHSFSGGVFVILDLVADSTEAANQAAQSLASLLMRQKNKDSVDLGILERADAQLGIHQDNEQGIWRRVPPLPTEVRIVDRFITGISWILAGVGITLPIVLWIRSRCNSRAPRGAIPLAQHDPYDLDSD